MYQLEIITDKYYLIIRLFRKAHARPATLLKTCPDLFNTKLTQKSAIKTLQKDTKTNHFCAFLGTKCTKINRHHFPFFILLTLLVCFIITSIRVFQ